MTDDHLSGDIKAVLKKYFTVVTTPKLPDNEYKDAHMSMYNVLTAIFKEENGGLVSKYYGVFIDTFAELAENTKAFSLERMFYGIQFMSGDYGVIDGYTSIMSLVSATYLPETRYSGTRFINMNKVLDAFVPVATRHYLTTYYRME